MNNRLRNIIITALIIAPGILQGLYIAKYGVNTLIGDEWNFVPFLEKVYSGGNWVGMLFEQLNEHRMVTLHLILAALARPTGWNTVVDMYITLFLECLTLLGLWFIYKQLGLRSAWAFIPIAWLNFSLDMYENYLYGMQLVFCLMVASAVWTLYLLSKSNKFAFILALGCAIVSSFSLISGLMVWPVGLVFLVLTRRSKRDLFVWTLAAVSTCVLYFVDWSAESGQFVHLIQQPMATVEFFLTTWGGALWGRHRNWALALGALLLVFVCVYCYKKIKTRQDPSSEELPAFCLILLSMLIAMAITFGRVPQENYSFMEPTSRYAVLTMPGFIGCYMLLARQQYFLINQNKRSIASRIHPAFAAGTAIFVIGMVATDLGGNYEAAAWHQQIAVSQYVVQTYDRQPDAVLGAPLCEHTPDVCRSYIAWLASQHISAFSTPTTVMLLTDVSGSEDTADILPNQNITQSVICTVPTLSEVSVQLTSGGQDVTSTIEISVMAKGKTLASTSFTGSDFRDASFALVNLDAPFLNCTNTPLMVVLQSLDAIPGNALHALVYPRYYDGMFSQAGTSYTSRDDRVLGIQLNAVDIYNTSIIK